MQAVILAAGMGSRLSAATGGKAKPLIEVGGRPLILHQLEMLADHGVGPALVIVGHQADEVQKVIGERAGILLNERFAETNSLYSLWLAREWIKGPFVLLNCDLLFSPHILDYVLSEPGNVLAYDSTSSRGREQTKVAIKNRRVVDLGKDLPPNSARGESLGLLKFDADGARALLGAADALVKDGQENSWVIEATRAACREVPIYGLNVAGSPWAEIDFPYDLDVARREVWPAIQKGRWRQQLYWRRTRWLAGSAAAFGLAVIGWSTSTKLGPASVNWETVPLTGSDVVRIDRAGESQRWWQVTRDSSVVGQVGGSEVVIELRLVLPSSSADTLRYVVSLSVDGKSPDWRVLTGTRDSSARLAGALSLGDRDRIRLALPPGLHQVTIGLTAAQSDRMLVRLRQPEDRDDEEADEDQ